MHEAKQRCPRARLSDPGRRHHLQSAFDFASQLVDKYKREVAALKGELRGEREASQKRQRAAEDAVAEAQRWRGAAESARGRELPEAQVR